MGRSVGTRLLAYAPKIAPEAAFNGGGGVGRDVDDHQWRSFDNSVNAVSFGFVATAILISMFLVMAIFEKFLRQRSSSGDSDAVGGGGAEVINVRKGESATSPKMSVYSKGVSVLMPGEEFPTFLAHHAPRPSN